MDTDLSFQSFLKLSVETGQVQTPKRPISHSCLQDSMLLNQANAMAREYWLYIVSLSLATIISCFPELLVRSNELFESVRKGNGIAGSAAFITLWGICLPVLVCSQLCGRRWIQLTVGLAFVIASVFIGTYYFSVDYPLQAIQFERLLTATGFAGDAAVQYSGAILKSFLLCFPLLVLVILGPRPYQRAPSRLVKAIGLGFVMPFIAVSAVAGVTWLGGGKGTAGTPGAFRPFAYYVALLADQAFGRESYSREITTDTPARSGLRNVVMVVDESIVDDVFRDGSDAAIQQIQLNIEDIGTDSGPSVSGSNCSSDSNFLLRVGPRPSNLDHDLLSYPTIWEYAKKAGYKTIYIDAQENSDNLHNRMTREERSHIDQVVIFPETIVYERDAKAGAALAGILGEEGKHFVYVNKAGAHFPWDSKYPASARKYTPTLGIDGNPFLTHAGGQYEILAAMDSTNGTEPFKNSYRNAAEWNYNTFFEAINNTSLFTETALIYTSDHGQNIWREKGNTATHCTNVPPSVTRVPLRIYTGSKELSEILQASRTANQGLVSHFNIFSSLIELMGYDSTAGKFARPPALWMPNPSPEGLITAPDGVAFRFRRPSTVQVVCPPRARLLPFGKCKLLPL